MRLRITELRRWLQAIWRRAYGTTPDAMVGKHDGHFRATPEQAELFRPNVLAIMARGETEIVF